MRIALVSHEYPPFGGGGIGTYATVMSDAFARAGHEVHLVTNRFSLGSTNPLHQLPVHQEGNLWVHRIAALTDAWEPAPPHDDSEDLTGKLHRDWSPYLYYSEMVTEALAGICDRHDIEVIEFPECAAEGYLTIRHKRLGLGFVDRPITVTLHSPIYEIYHYNLYSEFNLGLQRRTMMEEYSIRYADAVNSPSGLLAEIVWRRLGLAPGDPPCDVLALPMDFGSLPNVIEPKAAGAAQPPTLLFVGRLEPRKGVRYLVDAAVRVMQKHPDLHVLMIGRDCDAGEVPGKMTEFLRSRVPDSLRSRFVFPGPMPRHELFAHYAQATACVFAAPWDNFPLTCVEAMSSGACVIASDYTGMAEMIEHEESGLLFRAEDVDSLAGAIQRVLGEADLVARIRRNAPQRIRQVCDPDAAVRNRINHYQNTIQAHRRRVAGRPLYSIPQSQRVAVLIEAGTEAEKTLLSVQAAARHAHLEADITIGTIGGSRLDEQSPSGNGFRFGEAPDAAGAVRAWVGYLDQIKPDYFLILHAGDTLTDGYFNAMQAVLVPDPKVAWATTWMLPAGQDGVAYAGFDFSAPLDLLGYCAPPTAMIRYSAYKQQGGWNLDLPAGWREWDLYLAFEAARMPGLVVPRWLGRFLPRPQAGLPPLPHEHMTQVYKKIVARSPALFDRYGKLLWLYRTLNSVTSISEPSAATPADTSANWRHWRQLTKACLKQEFPGLARWYRRCKTTLIKP